GPGVFLTLCVDKEKQFVFDDRTTQSEAVISGGGIYSFQFDITDTTTLEILISVEAIGRTCKCIRTASGHCINTCAGESALGHIIRCDVYADFLNRIQ